jgi:hypothetical protein
MIDRGAKVTVIRQAELVTVTKAPISIIWKAWHDAGLR